MSIRTDLAIELVEEYGSMIRGLDCVDEIKNGIKINRITIKDAANAKTLNKPKGKYITLDMKNIALMPPVEQKTAVKIISNELKHLIDKNISNILVVGLGNRAITPDSIGPKTCEKVFVTRHIKEHIPEVIDSRSSTVFTIVPGVLGVTGLESFEVVKGIIEQTSPQLVIAVDALAARNTERIGSSVQMTNSGIAPGAGLGNRRNGLNYDTLGVNVIAIGVPTVVYASTIVSDMLDEIIGDVDDELKKRLIEKTQVSKGSELVVSPKDIDNLSLYASKMIAAAINMAVNPYITDEEIEMYMN